MNKDQSEEQFIGKYLQEWDIKDVIDIKNATSFTYQPTLEHKFAHNIFNGFKQTSKKEEQHKELISKLEMPGEVVRKYTITPQGVLLRKGEQIGMFQMGSTIAMIVECPPQYEVTVKEGERVWMGQEIIA